MKNLRLVNFFLSAILSVILFSSCNAYKELPYLKNSDGFQSETTSTGVHESKIMPDDILSITVNSTLPGAATSFNLPLVPSNLNTAIQANVVSTTSGTGGLQNYIVDKEGKIDFPVLGTLKIGGMTIAEAKQFIVSLIHPKYITEKPVVNIRFVNFKVSVLGEVARPGIYQTENGQMTILDALASAGDLTVYGKRSNVLLVRTNEMGEVSMKRIDLQDADLISKKDLFYLQQNDKIYVETNKAKGNNSRFGAFESISLSALSIVISVVAILTR